MKTKTINLYTFDELKPNVQKKVLQYFREQNEYHFLSDCLNERLHELLQENNIKDLNDTSKPNTRPTPVLYSLSHSQGDGAMFEGNFTWKDYQIIIKQSGHYYHSNSKTIEITFGDDIANDASEEVYIEFEAIYKSICKDLENDGYSFIESEDDEANIKYNIEINDYMFREDGTLENL